MRWDLRKLRGTSGSLESPWDLQPPSGEWGRAVIHLLHLLPSQMTWPPSSQKAHPASCVGGLGSRQEGREPCPLSEAIFSQLEGAGFLK